MSQVEDKRISEILLEGTAEASEMKNIVFANIAKELNLNIPKKKKQRNLFYVAKYGSIAVAVAMIIMLNTEPGHAAVMKVKEFFLPNKVVTQQIEGVSKTTNVDLAESTMNYIIYVDKEKFTLQKEENKDKITAKVTPKDAPEVFMEIQQISDKTPGAVASELENELKPKYPKVESKVAVTTPVKSLFIYANSGMEWNSTVIKYYLVDNTKGGTFVIKQQLFLEAEEGYGARFDSMLKEFKLVTK